MTPPRLRLTLGMKFVGLFLLIVVSTSSAVGWFLYHQSKRSMIEQLEQEASTIAWAVAYNCRQALQARDHAVLGELAAEALADDDVVYVRIHDAEGRILVERSHDGRDASRVPGALAAGAFLEVASPVRGAGGGAVGSVAIGLSRERIEEGLHVAFRSSILLFAAATALGVGLVLVFLQYVIKPIRGLSESLSHVTAGDLSTRLPEDRADEIGQLARAFNSMAEGLRGSRAAAREAQEALLHSTRLASVGEVAAQAAHEILNPLSAIYGRLENDRHHMTSMCQPMLQVLEQIVEGWTRDYQTGGWEGLQRSLGREVSGTNGPMPLLEEDLENLRRIAGGLRQFQSERAHDLDILLREVERVSRIVDGMRSLGRVGAVPQELGVEEILGYSVELMRDPLERRGIRIQVEAPPEPVSVRADRDEMVQIFTNLLRNSMQAIEAARGRGEGTISAKVSVEGPLVQVALTDNGSGILPEHQGRIFETTFTSKGTQEGTGLGLGICRRLARGAQGDVRLHWSAPGEGTTMVVELPRCAA